MSQSKIFISFISQGTGINLTPEYKFHPSRKWRFDYACPEHKIAIECEGGIYTNGRHTRGTGYKKDMEKYNAAVELGWRVLRFTPDELLTMKVVESIKKVLAL